jgi:hypothetical protein
MEQQPEKHTLNFNNLNMPQQQKLLKTLQSKGIEEFYNDNKGKCLWHILRTLLIIKLRSNVSKFYNRDCEGHNLQIRILTEKTKRILRDIRNGEYILITKLEPEYIPQFCEICNKKKKNDYSNICNRHYCYNCNTDYKNLRYSPEHYLSLAILECLECGYNEQL